MPRFIWAILVVTTSLQISGWSFIGTEMINFSQNFNNTVSRCCYIISCSQFVPHTPITRNMDEPSISIYMICFITAAEAAAWLLFKTSTLRRLFKVRKLIDEYRVELISTHTWNLFWNSTLWSRSHFSCHSSPISFPTCKAVMVFYSNIDTTLSTVHFRIF